MSYLNRALLGIFAFTFFGAASCGDIAEVGNTNTDGFRSKADSSAKTTLRGKITSTDVSKLAPKVAYLKYSSGKRVKTQIKNDSTFRFDSVPTGEATLVVNIASRLGAIKDVTLFGGGVNDVGAMKPVKISKIPRILRISGVGFEEMLRKKPQGNLYGIIFSNDREKLYAARSKSEERLKELVEIDLETGKTRILLKDRPITKYSFYEDSVWGVSPLTNLESRPTPWRLGRIVDDKYLIMTFDSRESFIAPVRGKGSKQRIIYNLEKEEIVFKSKKLTGTFKTSWQKKFGEKTCAYTGQATGPELVTDSAILMAIRVDCSSDVQFGERLRFLKFNLTTGTIEKGPLLSGISYSEEGSVKEYTSSVSMIASNERLLAYKSKPACRDEERAPTGLSERCPGLDSDIYILDIEKMKQYLVAEDYQSSAMPWRMIIPPGNEKTVVKVGLNGNVVRYEIEDSQLKRVDQSGYDSATNFSAQFFPGRTKRELLTIKNNDSEFVGEIYNTKTEKKTTISFDGAGFDCKSVAFSSWRRVQSDCLLGYTKNKRLRITERDFGEETPSSQGANFQLKTGVFRENEMVRKKLVRLWQNGDVIFPVSLQFVHDFYQHTEEGHEFGVGRVAGSKREQIFWRTDGGEFHRRTFLTAFHRYPRLGPKVGNLYYFSRDPLSGYIQLFRLQLDKLPTYE